MTSRSSMGKHFTVNNPLSKVATQSVRKCCPKETKERGGSSEPSGFVSPALTPTTLASMVCSFRKWNTQAMTVNSLMLIHEARHELR